MEKVIRQQKINKFLTSVSSKQEHKSKNFLASLLSPSVSKQRAKKTQLERNAKGDPKTISRKQESSESIYSSIEDFRPGTSRSGLDSRVEIESTELEKDEGSLTLRSDDSTMTKVPIYATVNKTKSMIYGRSLEEYPCQKKDDENSNKLLERLKDLSEENQLLKKQIQDFMNEGKRKDDTMHARLQLEMTQLEAETRKEVKSLSERLQILLREKEVLNEQIDLLVEEKKKITHENSDLSGRMKSMISPEMHNKMVSEYRNHLSEVNSQHKEEINKYRRQYESLEKERDHFSQQLKDTKATLSSSKKRIGALESSSQKLLQDKAEQIEQLEESKHIEHENQKLFLSLLKITENIAVERDILLNKASFQANQQKEIQTMVVDYSLNIGRLDEHLLNMGQKTLQHLQNLQSGKLHTDENLLEPYIKQLDVLRDKIINQNNTITELESDKRKLELQLEDIWETGCREDRLFLKK